MSTILIKNGLILSMATETPDIQTMDVFIEGDRISGIGRNLNIENADKIIDASDMVVMPGLVNCHSHAAMTLLRGYCDDLRLMEWLSQKIWPAEERMTGEDVYWGTMLGAAEMIKSGTTSFADMYFFMDEVATAVKDSGTRAALCQGLIFNDSNVERRIKSTYRLSMLITRLLRRRQEIKMKSGGYYQPKQASAGRNLKKAGILNKM